MNRLTWNFDSSFIRFIRSKRAARRSSITERDDQIARPRRAQACERSELRAKRADFFVIFQRILFHSKNNVFLPNFCSVKYRGWTNEKNFFSLFFIVFVYKMVASKMSPFPAFAQIFRERFTRNQKIKKIYNLYSFGYLVNYNQKFLLKKNKIEFFQY